ncbi:HAD family hydrolase [Cochlodiniinecator piscidefendens]|uniref:HAD family hydrolase n=1 Tax=Cochlodiniinecator piscidefendens TaxID=2715756 RepID=UPI001E6347DC|nr:HAD family hydrolase [Cochlodiniinecator piscidefendens]
MNAGSMQKVTTIGFDADDTLWHNEKFFRISQERFAELLGEFADKDHLEQRLLDAERRNLGHYGYGVKGFVLSMIETALDVTEERVPGSVIRELIDAGQEMLSHPIDLLPYVCETLNTLSEHHKVILITKGDLLDQERKLAQSGLGDLFDGVEIVSDKTPQIYHDIFTRHGDGPTRAMMVGNSMKSDVIPAIKAGAWGVYVPHGLIWELERADAPKNESRFRHLKDLGALPACIAAL